jgi:hypothetical protein
MGFTELPLTPTLLLEGLVNLPEPLVAILYGLTPCSMTDTEEPLATGPSFDDDPGLLVAGSPLFGYLRPSEILMAIEEDRLCLGFNAKLFSMSACSSADLVDFPSADERGTMF